MWLAVIDLACLLLGSVGAIMLRFGPADVSEYVFGHLDGWMLFYGSVLLANYLAGSYRLQYTFSRFNLVVTWLFSLVFAALILSLTSYAWFMVILGRGVLAFAVLVYSVVSLGLKTVVYRMLFRRDAFTCRTAILGTGARAMKLRQLIEGEHVLPAHKVVACVDVAEPVEGGASTRVQDGTAVIRCSLNTLEDVVRSLGVHLIVIAFEDMRQTQRLYPQLRRLRFEGTEVLTPLSVVEIYSGRSPLDQLTEEFLMQASMESALPMYSRTKRLFDIAISVVACVLLCPVVALLLLAIKLSDPRARAFYTQRRVGQFGKIFHIIKFRTMVPEAENGTGAVWASAGDPRITRLGRLLRRFRIDEIPQFINILRGEMSLVGPRPERPELAQGLAEQIPFYDERENIMPGLTGWAQVRYPYGSTVEDAARKLEYDLYYMKHMSLSLDLQIVLSTLRIVLFGKERIM